MSDVGLFTPLGGCGIRLTNVAVYRQIVLDYHFGSPVIFGRAPQELAATYGLTIYYNDPGVAASVAVGNGGIIVGGLGLPIHVEGTNLSGPPTVFSRVVSDSDPGGILVGVNWIDQFGATHPDVRWEWQTDVNLYTQTPNPPLGTYSQQIVTWTGDGVAGGQAIPTAFALDVGVTAVWIFPETNAPSGVAQFLRTTGMPGTISPASSIPNTLGGVMTLGPTGFTVKNHAPSLTLVNTLGAKYTAVVMNDTSGSVLFAGSYAGTNLAHGITTGQRPEVLWIWGLGNFRSTDYGGDAIDASSLLYNLVEPLAGRITGFAATGFSVGTNAAPFSNDAGTTYYYLLISAAGYTTISATLFRHFKATGGAPALVRVSGLPFTPGFAHTSVVTGANSIGGYWRGPWCLGAESHVYNDASALASLGIEEFGVDFIDLGHTAAPNGSDSYGAVWKTSGSVDVPSADTFTLVPPDTVGPGAACTAPVFP